MPLLDFGWWIIIGIPKPSQKEYRQSCLRGRVTCMYASAWSRHGTETLSALLAREGNPPLTDGFPWEKDINTDLVASDLRHPDTRNNNVRDWAIVVVTAGLQNCASSLSTSMQIYHENDKFNGAQLILFQKRPISPGNCFASWLRHAGEQGGTDNNDSERGLLRFGDSSVIWCITHWGRVAHK